MGQLCWQCDEAIGGALDVGEDVNREAGAAIVQFGDFVNPFVDLDDQEIEAASENEDLAITGDNIISDQFDAEPGGGFADTTLGGIGDVGGDVVEGGGNVVGGALSGFSGGLWSSVQDSAVALGIVALIAVYMAGQLFDVQIGAS